MGMYINSNFFSDLAENSIRMRELYFFFLAGVPFFLIGCWLYSIRFGDVSIIKDIFDLETRAASQARIRERIRRGLPPVPVLELPDFPLVEPVPAAPVPEAAAAPVPGAAAAPVPGAAAAAGTGTAGAAGTEAAS